MKERIISEIRRLAAESGGRSPGSGRFTRETGIRESEWSGKYWARWSDALKEANLQPNEFQQKHSTEFYLLRIADATRHHGRVPTSKEFQIYSRAHPGFPNVKSIAREFGSLTNVPAALAAWAASRPDQSDLSALVERRGASQDWKKAEVAEGSVYLIKSGEFYKVGRSDQLERRVKEIRVALPDVATLVHSIRTDDPLGIEAYWHKRFDSRRANGEWFKLTRADVQAFKKRKYQ